MDRGAAREVLLQGSLVADGRKVGVGLGLLGREALLEQVSLGGLFVGFTRIPTAWS